MISLRPIRSIRRPHPSKSEQTNTNCIHSESSPTLRGLNFEGLNFVDFADLGKIAKLSPSEKFSTGPSAKLNPHEKI